MYVYVCMYMCVCVFVYMSTDMFDLNIYAFESINNFVANCTNMHKCCDRRNDLEFQSNVLQTLV